MEQDTDVIVVGGGPAGLIAAGRAAECGARVLLLERNRRVGRKLLITGGGRCNVTNDIADRHTLVARYGPRGTGLHSVFARFGPDAMRSFLRAYGLETRVENEGRVFPVTQSAASVRDVLERYVAENGVTVRTSCRVRTLLADTAEASGKKAVTGVELDTGERVNAGSVVLATGGLSRPETGSTGDGMQWLASLGHEVRVPEPSLVPVAVREDWCAKLQGVALAEARLIVLLDGVRQAEATGKLLFTHFGLSGPLVLNLSTRINEIAQGGPVTLRIDLFPRLDGGAVERELQQLFDAHAKRKLRNALGNLVAPRLATTILERSGVDGDQFCHSCPRTARSTIARLLKELDVTFRSLLGSDKAVVSSGGVSPKEIDFRTMESSLVERLFVTGDLIDVDRQSGGYSLQLCWSTGRVAGESAAATPSRVR